MDASIHIHSGGPNPVSIATQGFDQGKADAFFMIYLNQGPSVVNLFLRDPGALRDLWEAVVAGLDWWGAPPGGVHQGKVTYWESPEGLSLLKQEAELPSYDDVKEWLGEPKTRLLDPWDDPHTVKWAGTEAEKTNKAYAELVAFQAEMWKVRGEGTE